MDLNETTQMGSLRSGFTQAQHQLMMSNFISGRLVDRGLRTVT
jgi:hypothetical protein